MFICCQKHSLERVSVLNSTLLNKIHRVTMNMEHYQREFIGFTKDCSKQNRLDFVRMLLGNLSVPGVKDTQNIASKLKKKKKKYSRLPTTESLQQNEDGWWELSSSELIINWAAITTSYDLIGYIKLILANFRESELQAFKSTFTYEARLKILHPDRAVSRPRPVPADAGWWTVYPEDRIVSMDCEMVSYIIGYRQKKGKKVPRCVNKAATVSVSSYDGITIYKRKIYHDPKNVYLTPIAKQKTGFNVNDFVDGTPMEQVRAELAEIFKEKLVIMIGSGSDFEALAMNKGDFDVFDLHEYFNKDTGKIGLRSLVMHYFNKDIQKGVHSADIDSIYTMKLFKDVYIAEKRLNLNEANMRGTKQMFNNINTVN